MMNTTHQQHQGQPHAWYETFRFDEKKPFPAARRALMSVLRRRELGIVDDLEAAIQAYATLPGDIVNAVCDVGRSMLTLADAVATSVHGQGSMQPCDLYAYAIAGERVSVVASDQPRRMQEFALGCSQCRMMRLAALWCSVGTDALGLLYGDRGQVIAVRQHFWEVPPPKALAGRHLLVPARSAFVAAANVVGMYPMDVYAED